jgi:hypothetical protein
MIKNKIRPIGIAMFFVAALLLAYVIYAFINSHTYISDLIDSGQIVPEESRYDILSFYMTNCALYALFAILFVVIGIYDYLRPLKDASVDNDANVGEEVELDVEISVIDDGFADEKSESNDTPNDDAVEEPKIDLEDWVED